MYILIRGAGDLATGIALRLYRSGYPVLMTDVARPLAVRRTVSFCSAIASPDKEVVIEGVRGVVCLSPEKALTFWEEGKTGIPLLVDPQAHVASIQRPAAVVDAIMAKRNLGTNRQMAPFVIGIGPGFTALQDVDVVIETKRGHYLGRVIREGQAIPNTGIPGEIGGYGKERLLRASADGLFQPLCEIGAEVEKDQAVALVEGKPVKTQIKGILRGLLADGTPVTAGLKCGDVDPRCEPDHVFTASDKALAIGGGVLEALLEAGIYPSSKEKENHYA